MIISELLGGLGNQMFQYAAGKALAEHYKTDFKIDVTGFKNYTLHGYDLNRFCISAPEARDSELPEKKPTASPTSRMTQVLSRIQQPFVNYTHKTIFEEPFFHYNKRFFSLPSSAYLRGYFQSEKYFHDIQDIIRAEFTLKPEFHYLNDDIQSLLTDNEVIAVHFRRGDYVTNKGINSVFGTPSLAYYHKAIAHIAAHCKRPRLFIFSNDTQWVREQFVTDLPVTYVSDFKLENFQELDLISRCAHMVIANSSFSWWGAWLGTHLDKRVCAPKAWFRSRVFNTKDITPDSWIRL